MVHIKKIIAVWLVAATVFSGVFSYIGITAKQVYASDTAILAENTVTGSDAVSDAQLKQDLKELYQKCLNNSGKSSFHGWCGSFVGHQLKALGIQANTSTGFNGNGNTWYPCLLDGVETASGHTQKKYPGRDCLKSIAADSNGEPVYDIVVSFPNSTGSNTSYGHVIFIYAIVGNTAYYIESYGTSYGAEGTPIARDINGLMNEYCSLYGNAQGAVWFSGGGSSSYITDDKMYSTYSKYLYDESFMAALSNAKGEIDTVIKESDGKEGLISVMAALKSGTALLIQELASKITGQNSKSDDIIDQATVEFVQTMLENETFVSSAITSGQKALKELKYGYDFNTSAGKTAFSQATSKLLNVDKDKFNENLDKALGDSATVLKVSKYGLDIASVIVDQVELEWIDMEVVSNLMHLLDEYGYSDTELYKGLTRLYSKLHTGVIDRIFDNIAEDTVLSAISKLGTKAVEAASAEIGSLYALLSLVEEVSVYIFYEKLGQGITADALLNTYAQKTFADTIYCLFSDMRSDLFYGTVDLNTIPEDYELVWNAYRASIASGLESAKNVTGSKTEENVLDMLKKTVTQTCTYNAFFERCRANAMQALINGTAVTTGSTVAADKVTKSENMVIKKLNSLEEMYPSGTSTFEIMYNGKMGSFAFTEFLFNMIYNDVLNGTVSSSVKYKYSSYTSARKIGTLQSSEASADAIATLFESARTGDVILANGKAHGTHSMIYTGKTENGIMVYDCGWNPDTNGEYGVLLHEITYEEIASWVGTATADSDGGISLYHYYDYDYLYTTSGSIMADDKESFIIDENGTLTGYKGYKTFIKIPDTVKAIADKAFYNNDMIRNVYIPNSVVSIGDSAFYDCDQLTSVFIPDSVTSIGTQCFYDCGNLSYVKLSDNMDAIKSNTFSYCSKLETVVMGLSVTSIGEMAFFNCKKLSNIDMPPYIKTLCGMAFGYCVSLTKIEISKSLTSAGSDWVVIGYNTYTYVGPFYGCSNLSNIKINADVTKIVSQLFSGCNGVETIVLPSSVTVIGENAFRNCSKLKNVNMSNNIQTIQELAFYNCCKLENVNLPKSLHTLMGMAFGYCVSLDNITIPKSLTSAGSDWVVIGYNTYTYVGPFIGCNNLKNVGLEEGITKIPSLLFKNTMIESICIPDTVKSIGSSAFANCSMLKVINTPSALTDIGSSAFANCTSLETASIPSSIETWGTGIYKGCTSLKSATIPNGFGNIQSETFMNCKSLTEFTFPDTLKTIRSSAFAGSGLTSINIPDSCTEIQTSAFEDCENLISVKIPDTVATLGSNVFAGCSLLRDVNLGRNITAIPENAFKNCSALESLTIPYYTTQIGSNAFTNDTSLKEVIIHRNVKDISSSAFSYPDKMTIYGVPGTYAETFATDNNFKFVGREINASEIKLDNTTLSIEKGSSYRLSLTITPDNFTDAITWKSSDTSIATVSDTGVVKGIKGGTATIKVTVGNVSTSCKVTVLQPVTSISINSNMTLEAMDTYQLSAYIYPSDANNKSIIWTSSDNSVATVSATGLVTALKKGSTTITATAADGSGEYDTCVVTVSNSLIVCDNVSNMESTHNYENSCSDIWQYTSAGAKALDVVFDSRTNVEDGYDYILIYDKDDLQGKYTGTELASQTIRVNGNTVRIKLSSDSSSNEWGFKVTKITPVTTSHTLEYIDKAYATCTSKGHNAYYHCKDCDKIFKDNNAITETTIDAETIPELGHDWIEDRVISPTYTNSGYTLYVCSRCNQSCKSDYTDKLILAYPEFKSVSNTTGGLVLKWSPADDAKGYIVYRKNGNEDWHQIAVINNGATLSYTDKTAKPGTLYTYALKSYIGNVISDMNSGINAIRLSNPTVTSATNVSAGIQVKWANVIGASGYIIYRKTGSGSWGRIGTSSSLSYIDKTAKSGTGYTYTVRAYSGNTMSSWNSTKSVKRLADPTVSSAANITAGVHVKWAKVTGASGYVVYRKTGSGSWGRLTTTTALSYVDKTAKSGTNYSYTIRAYNGKTMSDWHNYKTIRRLANPAIKSAAKTTKGINVKWSKVTGAAGYALYRKTGNGSWTRIATIKGGSVTSYTDTKAAKGVTYTYTIRAYNGSTMSSFNSTKSAKR